MEFTAQLPVIGLDLAKSVFQLHIVDMESGVFSFLHFERRD